MVSIQYVTYTKFQLYILRMHKRHTEDYHTTQNK